MAAERGEIDLLNRKYEGLEHNHGELLETLNKYVTEQEQNKADLVMKLNEYVTTQDRRAEEAKQNVAKEPKNVTDNIQNLLRGDGQRRQDLGGARRRSRETGTQGAGPGT